MLSSKEFPFMTKKQRCMYKSLRGHYKVHKYNWTEKAQQKAIATVFKKFPQVEPPKLESEESAQSRADDIIFKTYYK